MIYEPILQFFIFHFRFFSHWPHRRCCIIIQYPKYMLYIIMLGLLIQFSIIDILFHQYDCSKLSLYRHCAYIDSIICIYLLLIGLLNSCVHLLTSGRKPANFIVIGSTNRNPLSSGVEHSDYAMPWVFVASMLPCWSQPYVTNWQQNYFAHIAVIMCYHTLLSPLLKLFIIHTDSGIISHVFYAFCR